MISSLATPHHRMARTLNDNGGQDAILMFKKVAGETREPEMVILHFDYFA